MKKEEKEGVANGEKGAEKEELQKTDTTEPEASAPIQEPMTLYPPTQAAGQVYVLSEIDRSLLLCEPFLNHIIKEADPSIPAGMAPSLLSMNTNSLALLVQLR